MAYQPAQLAGVKGFSKNYVSYIRPSVQTLRSSAPNFTMVAEWEPLPFEAMYLSPSRPGYTGSKYATTEQVGYQGWAKTAAGMGVYSAMTTINPLKIPSYDPIKKTVRFGSTDLSMIDPLGSIENVTGEFFGLKTPVIGAGGTVADPLTWFNERNIGLENYPSRLMDYAFATPVMIGAKMLGVQMSPSAPRNDAGDAFFPFENNPAYWYSLGNWKGTGRPPTDDELLNEAKEEAAKISMAPSLLIPALYERYKWGRDVMVSSKSSGNERIDYMAKKELESVVNIIQQNGTDMSGYINLRGSQEGSPILVPNNIVGIVNQFTEASRQVARGLTTMIPGIGTGLASTLMPVDDATEALWNQLTPDVRRSLLSDAGMTVMATDLWATLPLLSGAGALVSAMKAGVKGGEFMAWAAREGIQVTGAAPGRAVLNVAREAIFDIAGMAPRATRASIGGFGTTLMLMDRVMATGMTMMTANWALESFVPGYAEEVGYAIDKARPFSESSVDGLINFTGYFSSATAGGYTAVRTLSHLPRSVGSVVSKTGLLGQTELRGFASHFGGAAKVSDAQRFYKTELGMAPTEAELTGPVKSTISSQLGNELRELEVARVRREYIDNPAMAEMELEGRVELANNALRDGLQNLGYDKTRLAALLESAHSTNSFLGDVMLTDFQRVQQGIVSKYAREIEDRMAGRLAMTYSDAWWSRQFRNLGISVAPENPVSGYRMWLRKEAARRGWTFDEAAAVKAYGNDAGEWKRLANLMHANEYHAVNAQVIEAAKVSPTDLLQAHPEDYFVMRSSHLFTDRADFLRSAISQLKTDTPLITEQETRELAGRLIRTTEELDEWWARLRGKSSMDPRDVDLDALNKYVEEIYSLLPGRHPVNVTGPTADYPINAVARRLNKEGVFTVAYKPKGDIIAYKPTAKEMAVRVSQNAPEGYVVEAPVGVRAALDVAADGQFHVTMNRDAVMAEGLRSRAELVGASGDELMFHGSSSVWYQFDPARASEGALVGKGLYLTESHRVGRSYNMGGSQGMVKEFRIPADARIWDAEAPMDDLFFALLDADIAKGQAGRLWKAADKARAESGDMLDPDAYLRPGGEWEASISSMEQARGVNGQRESYIDSVVDGGAVTDYAHHFKNAVNDILFDGGYEGLTHIGGKHIGGMGEHKVYVLFDPDATVQRAQALGTGAGGSINDPGREVSLTVNEARAQVLVDRYTLAVRAARGETTIDEIVTHFVTARMSTGGSAEAAWRDMWDEVARANVSAGFDRAIADVTGAPVQAYYTPYDRSDFLKVLDSFYNPALNKPFWTGRQEADRLAAMGDLVSVLDNALEKGGPLKIPMAADGVTYDAAGWARYSADIKQRSSQLAKVDPSQVGIVRVARRAEVPPPIDSTPRMTEAEVATGTEGWEAVGNMSYDDAALFLYKELPPSALGDLIDNGLRVGTYGDTNLRASNAPRLTFHTNEGFKTANDMMLARVRASSRSDWVFDGSGLPRRYLDADVKPDMIEVFGKDGAWHRLGLMDRKPQDPMPSETLDQWTTRLWEDVQASPAVPMEPRDSYFVAMSGSVYDEGMRTGTFQPESSWDYLRAYGWDEVTSTRQFAGMSESYIVEFDKNLTVTAGVGNYNRTFGEAPKAAVKRVWTQDQQNGQFLLSYERRQGTFGEGDFFRTGRAPGEIKASSNHLWVVDDQAKASHAGWRDQDPQPLDNQWEQPWKGVVEDPSAGAEAIYKHVSYVRLKDGTVVKAPFLDYPMNPGDIYLGNRTLLGRKYDSIFQGVRSWRMAEHHLAQMSRIFAGRYGFTTSQVELFTDRVNALSRSDGFSGIGHGIGEIKITPYATARLRSDKVNAIAEQVFGKEPVKNLVTGAMETPNYARLFADAHQQAWSLNLSSGIVSRIKNFDLLSIGPLATWTADWLIPVLRFKASPIFRTSELFESKVFNNMRGVNVSEEERAVFAEAGMHPNANLLASDFGADPMLESMFTATQNRAASQTMAGIHGLDDLAAGEGSTGTASSYAIWRDVNALFTKKGATGLLDDMKDPARYKNGLMFDQQIEVIKRELPIIIKTRDPEAYRILSEVMKVPDAQMARFIAEDRILYGRWQRGAATFEDLLAHSNLYAKEKMTLVEAEQMKAIYATEDWQAIETLMRVASMSAQSEAFGTHFFGSYRSAMERSINHPLLGIYPASWAYKAAKEWARFLYDNRMLGHGDVRLGMFPAVAMNQLVKQVNVAVAQNTGQNWQEWLDNGPARNLLFLWNLLLPGDWSSLPLPLARPLRSISRAIMAGEWEKLAPWNLAADTLMGPSGRGGIGIIRDINLSARGIADLYNYFATDKPGEWDNLAEGLSLGGVEKKPINWSDLEQYPDPFGVAAP